MTDRSFYKFIFLVAVVLLFSSSSLAQTQNNKAVKVSSKKMSTLKTTDFMALKANLEDILVRRYTQDLSSTLDKERFSIGASFELVIEETKKEKLGPLLNDLELSYLDAEYLLESYASQFEKPEDKYLIKGVSVNVGLDPELDEEAKGEVEAWLTARLNKEFGSIGTSNVDFLKKIVVEDKKSNVLLKWMKDYQLIIGCLILAIALILSFLLRGFFSVAKSAVSSATGSSPTVNIESQAEISPSKEEEVTSKERSVVLTTEIEQVTKQIKEFSHKLGSEVNELVTEWCNKGESGLYRLACFAETSSTIVGTLPIPSEYKKKMGDLFSEMHSLEQEEKLKLLQQTYWDLVATHNLGAETLKEPFSFISSASLDTINKVLLENDIDTQTVVTMYMPEDMRKSYLSELDEDKKIELLNKAAQLSTVTEDYLKSVEDQYAPYFTEGVSESEVSMDLTLTKLVEALSVKESCKILPKIEGPVVERFKLSTPHLAFLPQWESEESLKYLIKRCTNEELLAYLRAVPEMTDKIIEQVSPRAQQILKDDLEQQDSFAPKLSEELLVNLNKKIVDLVNSGDIDLRKTIKSNSDKADIKIAA